MFDSFSNQKFRMALLGIVTIFLFEDIKTIFVLNWKVLVLAFAVVVAISVIYTFRGVAFEGNALTSLGIIFAIFILIIQSWQSDTLQINSLRTVNTYNCNSSLAFISLLGVGTVPTGRYITDIYGENLEITYRRGGKDELMKYMQAIHDMDSYNRLANRFDSFVDSGGVSSPEPVKMLLAFSEGIKRNFCGIK